MFIADVHWSEQPPVARSVEDDWLRVQKVYMQQLRGLQMRLGRPPLFIAGDLFNVWNSSAHLINNVLEWLEGMVVFAVPGNHDLPHHSYRQVQRSAYWTLVEAKAITNLTPGGTHSIGQLNIYPFPHGFQVTPPRARDNNGLCLDVALIHDYIWTKNTGHKDAPEDHRYAQWLERHLKGYDAAVFGDNHKGFLIQPEKKCAVLNCGTFMRRYSDEKDYRPCVGLLHSNGTFSREYLDTTQDRWLNVQEQLVKLEETLELDLAEFAAELSDLHSERLDYAKTVLAWVKKEQVPDEVKEVLLRCLQQKRKK